jgi:hypothetical protein
MRTASVGPTLESVRSPSPDARGILGLLEDPFEMTGAVSTARQSDVRSRSRVHGYGSRGGPDDRSEATRALSEIALGDGGYAWRAGFDPFAGPAEGTTDAVLLRGTVELFRRNESSSGWDARGVAALLGGRT